MEYTSTEALIRADRKPGCIVIDCLLQGADLAQKREFLAWLGSKFGKAQVILTTVDGEFRELCSKEQNSFMELPMKGARWI